MSIRTTALDAAGEPHEAASEFDLDTLFRDRYPTISRTIARVVGDPARAEELAVEAFLRLWRHPSAHGDGAPGWLYRTAVRLALDELRRQKRRERYRVLLAFVPSTPTPEEVRAATEQQDRVRRVLATISRRDAELLVLRNQGLTYDELASALDLKPASIGTLLRRARHAFRTAFLKQYGDTDES